jgi:hypothetical protein
MSINVKQLNHDIDFSSITILFEIIFINLIMEIYT